MNKFTRAVCVETDFDIFVKKSVFPWKALPWKNRLENLRNVEIKTQRTVELCLSELCLLD